MDTLKASFESRLTGLVSTQDFQRWFSPIFWRLSRDGATLTVEAPTIFHQRQLSACYQDLVQRTAAELGLKIDRLFFTGPGAGNLPSAIVPERSFPRAAGDSAAPPAISEAVKADQTFENFIIDDNNRMPCLALKKMAHQEPGDLWAVFISSIGPWGKSHLLNALANELSRKGRPFIKIGGSQFLEWEDPGRQGTEARNAWRQICVAARFIIFDDIHLLEASSSAQRFFRHVFDEVAARRACVVISASRPPQELTGLVESLRSRLSGGLNLALGRPAFETLMTGTARKARALKLDLTKEILSQIVRRSEGDWRQIDGDLGTLSWAINNSSTGLVEAVNKFCPAPEAIRKKSRVVDLELILHEVARTFNLKSVDITAHNKARQVAWPRRVVMYLARELTNLTTSDIGQALGRRDHSTVIHALKRIHEEMKEPDRAQVVENIKIKILAAYE